MTNVIERPIEFSGKIGLAPLMLDVIAYERRLLATTLHGPLSQLSVPGPFTRALQMIVSQIPQADVGASATMAPRDLITLVTHMGTTLVSVADRLMMLQQADVARAMRLIWDQDMLTQLISQLSPDGMTLSPNALHALIYGLLEGEGALVRPGTQHAMSHLGLQMLHLQVGIQGASSEKTAKDASKVDFLVASGLWRDLQSCYRQELLNPEAPRSIADDNRSRAVVVRANILKSAALTILGRTIASYLRVAKGLSVWVGAPPIQAALAGRRREEADRAKEYADAILSKLGSRFPSTWELYTPDTFDIDLIGAWSIVNELSAGLIGGLSGPVTPITGGILMEDVTWPVTILPGAIDTWLNTMWYTIESAEQLAQHMSVLTDEAYQPLRQPDSVTVSASEPAEFTAAITPVAGIPFIPPSDIRIFLPNEGVILRDRGVGPWVVHTLTEIREVINRDQSLKTVPVHVEHPQGVYVIPVFEGIDDYMKADAFLDTDQRQSVARMMEMSAPQMDDFLRTFAVPSSRGLRLLADAISLCGMLTTHALQSEATTHIIAPSSGYYYHGEDHSPNLGVPIDLGPIGSGDILTFIPFATLPSSVNLERFEQSLVLDVRSDTVPTPSYSVRWLQRGPIKGSPLRITGWRRTDRPIGDIVSIRPTTGFRGCQLLLGAQGQIEGARVSNAVVSTGSESPSWSPTVSTLHSFSLAVSRTGR
jgi:hypothetical protein